MLLTNLLVAVAILKARRASLVGVVTAQRLNDATDGSVVEPVIEKVSE